MSQEFPDLEYQTFLTPSISPIYNNNPSFTIIELVNQKILESKSWSFDLSSYTFFRGENWREIDWIEEFKIDFNDGSTIRDLYQRMENDPYLFNKYESMCYGMTWVEEKYQ